MIRMRLTGMSSTGTGNRNGDPEAAVKLISLPSSAPRTVEEQVARGTRAKGCEADPGRYTLPIRDCDCISHEPKEVIHDSRASRHRAFARRLHAHSRERILRHRKTHHLQRFAGFTGDHQTGEGA